MRLLDEDTAALQKEGCIMQAAACMLQQPPVSCQSAICQKVTHVMWEPPAVTVIAVLALNSWAPAKI
jgi:hypothetical protein